MNELLWAMITRKVEERATELVDDIMSEIKQCLAPKSPVTDRSGFIHCPICGQIISRDHAEREPRYCEMCGQELDWS